MLSNIDFIQNAYCVDNLENACDRLNKTLGLGPFLGGGDTHIRGHVYRGKPAEPIHIRSVFAHAGSTLIELIEVLSKSPSAFHDMLPETVEPFAVLHHTAYFAKDYQADRDHFEQSGFPIASEFAFDGQRVCYADTRSVLGHMVEIYPEHPIIRSMYAQTKAAHFERGGEMRIDPFQF